MNDNVITAGTSIGEAPQASNPVDEGAPALDPQASPLAGQPGAPEGEETTEEAVARMVHGMDAEELLAALEEGVIPEDLYEHLRIKMKVDGIDEEVSLSDHRKERMMLNDYSRKMNQLRIEKADFTRSQEAFGGMIEAWKNKDPMQVRRTYNELERLGLPIHELTTMYAQRHNEQREMVEAVPDQLRPMFKSFMEEREEMRRTIQHLEYSRQQQPQRQQQQGGGDAAIRERIQRMSPAAFKKENLPEGETTRAMFYQHLGAIWDRSGELTQQHVNDAARAVRLDIERNVKALGYGKVGGQQPGGDGGQPRRVVPAPGMQPGPRRAAAQAPRTSSTPTNGAATLDQLRARWDRNGS